MVGMTCSLFFSVPHCTQIRPISRLTAVSTIFLLLGRAGPVNAAFARVRETSTLAPVLVHRRRIAVKEHPCFLWRRDASSKALKMANILESPSAERNKGPINEVLEAKVYPRVVENVTNDSRSKVNVLELAAGCGVHTTHFVSAFLSGNKDIGMEWHPSDPDPDARLSIDARVQRDGLQSSVVPANGWILGKSGGTAFRDNHRDKGDAGEGNAGDAAVYEELHDFFDLALCINMMHIAPYEATKGLMECAGKVLRKGGMLVCYGPFKVGGTAVESNLNFDRNLRSRNPEWGVRDLEDVIAIAKAEGLDFKESIEMPANNLSVLFCKT
mmetsp:Transcript_1152/g.2024  ORF Transcript_1152/g.2024 Transcript_1152/m.2024 type:complete len:327 (-) Transcript_1152:380-1360(-)